MFISYIHDQKTFISAIFFNIKNILTDDTVYSYTFICNKNIIYITDRYRFIIIIIMW